ncbi:MAG: acetylxylan esterase [Verrucomicrobiae bacterium]|nr:acetylxylan esterase [Verrucomicrobiae bacterium]
MPLIDKPLAELETYAGTNPCPNDMDAFWDRSLAEMRALDPKVELRPAAFAARGVECFHLFFTGVGGSRVHAKLLRPKGAKQKLPAMLLFHGYSGRSGDWFDKLAWVSQGFVVAALDCRGQSGLSEDLGSVKGGTFRGHIVRGLDDSPEKLAFRQIYLDTAQLARIVMNLPEVDPRRVGAAGGSQGGGLTLACAALEPSIKLAASIYPFLCDYKRVWEMDLAKDAYQEIRDFFRWFDPRHEREDEIWTRLGYIDCQHLAKRIRAEVLMLTGLMDTVCPPSTQFAAYNKMVSKKRMILYPDFAHEGMPDMWDVVHQFMAKL